MKLMETDGFPSFAWSKFRFFTCIEFIRLILSNFYAHVAVVCVGAFWRADGFKGSDPIAPLGLLGGDVISLTYVVTFL